MWTVNSHNAFDSLRYILIIGVLHSETWFSSQTYQGTETPIIQDDIVSAKQRKSHKKLKNSGFIIFAT